MGHVIDRCISADSALFTMSSGTIESECVYPLDTPPENLVPSEARALFRRNEYHGSTSRFCLGYDQANLIILPASLADDFEEFCKQNHAAFPLLYRSKEGESSASLLAREFDVKYVGTLATALK